MTKPFPISKIIHLGIGGHSEGRIACGVKEAKYSKGGVDYQNWSFIVDFVTCPICLKREANRNKYKIQKIRRMGFRIKRT
jgi:hypothetical protein